jgi:hypothetical protein
MINHPSSKIKWQRLTLVNFAREKSNPNYRQVSMKLQDLRGEISKGLVF